MSRKIAAFITAGCAFILSIIGIFLIYSASRRNFAATLLVRQVIWLLIGLAGFFAVNSLRRRNLYQLSWWCYGAGILLLIITLFFAPTVRGGQSWIDFGFLKMQSSELMKVFLLMALSSLSVRMAAEKLAKTSGVFLIILLVLLPVSLILLAGDTGTALIYLFVMVCWFFVLGVWREGFSLFLSGCGVIVGVLSMVLYPEYLNPVYNYLVSGSFFIQGLTILFVGGLFFITGILPYLRGRRISNRGIIVLALISFFLGNYLAFFLKDYQSARLIAFVDPYQAPLETGYNIIQSQIALGSGGWFGQGYLRGSQSQLGFVPELWTDFIFTVGVEELGLVFALFMLTLFIFLVYGAFSAASQAEEWWDYYICAGAGVLWLTHTVVNLGVCVGLLPVMGLPLPFVSYGGSFMVTNWLLVGIIVSLSDRPRGLSYLE